MFQKLIFMNSIKENHPKEKMKMNFCKKKSLLFFRNIMEGMGRFE